LRYGDTSAVIKLYRAEAGTDAVRTLVDDDERWAISVLTGAEVRAALARDVRVGALSPERMHAYVEDFEALTAPWLTLELSRPIAQRVTALCVTHPLRAADAVHLATALALADRGLTVTFVCSDRALLDAAAAEGLPGLDPAAG
jgi:predicted nucleic acid-binding protein